MSGEKFDLNENAQILKINSPKVSVGGPYVVVFKDVADRWAIVALDWDGEPRLGIRWFWGSGGNPFSSAHPTWLIIPSSLSNSVLNGLPLDFSFKIKLEKFLSKEIVGKEISVN